ncbi:MULTISPECIES: rod shape-determining protein MreD [Eubacteriales]|uniref:Rod shape-determining protein MreD n=1 Tax=Bittarella massiliensis (ex Durand et al. 2017) TaxID=1720313 RepID=A0AAQ1RVP4_9FIRM|nr:MULTISPECIES: rod shape-determining protein MreD [Eubacteriales]ERI99346.1 putative rod shape-determining protein MreD [Clostridium sp. ATCC 29733]MZL70609.1 rod shape-determining protein MreD [Bittarella massiliensis (ex Durand et al. 2017)]MZL81394.1 rod shape-determining protein MreD [Bittarella massiliensis (ex Durand et al. 2017)]SHG03590.1 rod shape-determining protein MreD [Bittarella massiliensis (ex Durand et al. 2017)]
MPTKKGKERFLKWLFYALLLFFCYIVQTTPGLLAIGSIQPVLVVPVCLAVAILENELAGAIFGALAGLMWDLSASRISGFFGIILCVLCVAVSFCFLFWIRQNTVNFTLACAAALLVAVGLDYLFNFLIFYQGGSLYLLLHTLLPMAGYTLVYCPPLFWLARRIARRYAVEE